MMQITLSYWFWRNILLTAASCHLHHPMLDGDDDYQEQEYGMNDISDLQFDSAEDWDDPTGPEELGNEEDEKEEDEGEDEPENKNKPS